MQFHNIINNTVDMPVRTLPPRPQRPAPISRSNDEDAVLKLPAIKGAAEISGSSLETLVQKKRNY